MSSPKAKPEVPNPYELAEVDAQKLGYVDFDLKTLELDKDFNVDANLKTESDVSSITRDIVNSLLESSDPIAQIMSNYDRKLLSKHFKNQLVRYFQFIFTRLQQPDVNYLNLHDENPEYDSEFYCDFASFGARFWQVLTDSFLFSRDILHKLSKLIYRYLKLYPQEILNLREGIVKTRLQLAINPPAESAQLKLIIDKALKQIDNCKLFADLSQIKSRHADPFDHFMKTLDAPFARIKLTEELRKVIESIFSDLKPQFVQVGGSANIDYRVLQFQLSFDIAGLKILDRSTRSMVMTPIVQVMAKMGLTGAPCNRSVVINLGDTRSDEYDRKLVISVCSDSLAFSKLVDFYLRYDARFGPMVLMLKYYVTESKLSNCNRAFIKEPIIWLIIYFLQQTEPAVLLSFDALCSQTEENAKDELVHFCTDLGSFDASSNDDSIGELVVKFIEWFCKFDFDTFLELCDGSSNAKNERSCFNYDPIRDGKTYRCNPFFNLLQAILAKEDVNQWKKVFAKLKNHFRINSKNYLLVLTNPKCFKAPDFSELSFMRREPQNPFLLKSEDADELEYPEDINSLVVMPELTPFENEHTQLYLLFGSPPYFDSYQFLNDFIFTSKSINEILESYNCDHLQFHYTEVLEYFVHLQSRLLKIDLSYDELLEVDYDGSHDASQDYASYGERFWQWLIECKLFPANYLRNYSVLIYRYLEKFPQSILSFRTLLLDIYLKMEGGDYQEAKLADYKLVTLSPFDKDSLHKEITCKNNSRDQLDYLITQVYQRNQSKRCTDFIIEMINSDEHLKPLKLSLEQCDVLHGDFNLRLWDVEDFYFYVKFNDITDKLDWATFVMALYLIDKSINRRFVVGCSLLKCSFLYIFMNSAIPSNKDLTNVSFSLYSYLRYDYSGNALELLSQFDQRFGEITLLIKYWSSLNDFSRRDPFDTHEFAWLIVHFLQKIIPPVLPPLKQLFQDVKSIEPSTNRHSTTELIVLFFKFYTQFDFNDQVICPLDGVSYTKDEHCEMNDREEFDEDCFSLYENPLTKEVYNLFCDDEDSDRFVNVVTKLLNEYKIDSENCIEVLTDPSINVEGST